MNTPNPSFIDDCPDDDQLHRFLNHTPADESIEEHVNDCSLCQQKLQQMTVVDSPDWKRLMPSNRSDQVRFGDTALLLSTMTKDKIPVSDLTAIGRFHIERELGRGGMGIVYLATDPNLGRRVAVKLLARSENESARWSNRFDREAKLAGSLNHPNVLTIHEIGNADGTPYIATEFVRGVTLRRRLDIRPFTEEETLDLAAQLVSGLVAAHGAGIVHRDLKPDNVMIRDDGLLKILDFGLARLSVENLTDGDSISNAGMLAGTVSYMSPEQARGLELTISSDVFSLGTLLFQMLTGKRPFPGETHSDVIAAILSRAPLTFESCDVFVSPRLIKLVMSCLNKNSDLRPNSVEILSELKEISAIHKSLPGSVDQSSARTPALSAPEFSASDHGSGSPIRYAQSENINIAWQVIGDGPIDIVFVMGWVSHLEWFWKDPSFAAFLNRLASFARVILFDKRGTGLSDKVPVDGLPTLETRMDDVRAVMDAADSERAVLLGVSEGGPLCTLFAATYPEKTIAIAMVGCYARRLWADDYPWGVSKEHREQFLEEIAAHWGGPLGIEDRAPSKANDPEFRKWWAGYLRMGASPGAAVALTRMNAQIDVRPILPSVQVPTLVIHRTGDRCLRVEEGRHIADLIPGAKFVALPGDDHLPFVGDSEAVLNQIEEFLTGMRRPAATDQVLATVLCVLIESASDSKLNELNTVIRANAKLFRGQNITESGRRMLLTFDGPARAVRAASSFVGLGNRMDVDVRCGADTGMCEIGDALVAGPAAERSFKIADMAALNEVLVSNAVLNLTSGSGLNLIEAGQLDDSHGDPVHRLVG